MPSFRDLPFVQVNAKSFRHALVVADQRGDRISLGDPQQFLAFCRDRQIDPSVVQSSALHFGATKIAAIDKGLMEGLYVYSADGRLCYRFRDHCQGSRTLAEYRDDFAYDVCISYATADRKGALSLQKTLELADIKTFLIDVEADASDPLWKIRYREAMFFSRYLLLLMTDNYLTGEGARKELFDGARLAIAERQNTFLYPFVVLTENAAALATMNWAKKRTRSQDLDPEDFAWLRRFAFPLALDRGIEWLTRFLRSVLLNASGTADFAYLECLSGDIESLELHTFPANFIGEHAAALANCDKTTKDSTSEAVTAVIHLRHPDRSRYSLILSSRGAICRYAGVHEPGQHAVRSEAFNDPVQAVIDHLRGRHSSPSAVKTIARVAGRQLPQFAQLDLTDVDVDVQLDENATRLLARFGDQPATVHELNDGQRLIQVDSVSVASLSPNGSCVAAGNSSRFFLTSGANDQRVPHGDYSNGVRCLAWSSGGTRLCVGMSMISSLRVLDSVTLCTIFEVPGKQLFSHPDVRDRTLFCVALSPDGETFAAGGMGGLVIGDQRTAPTSLHSRTCYHSEFSPDGRFLVGSFYDGSVRVFKSQDRAEHSKLQCTGPVMQATWLNDDTLLIRHRIVSKDPHRSVVWCLQSARGFEISSAPSDGPASVARKAGIVLMSHGTSYFQKLWTATTG